MKPAHRSHTGWLSEVMFRPEIPRRVKKLVFTLTEHGTYRNKRNNQYACTRERLAQMLEIDERNVQRSLVWAVDNGWLIVCVRGQKGRQQVYHRSVPWDHPRYWRPEPCPACRWRTPARKRPSLTVDRETGEIVQGDVSTGYNVSLSVSPTSSSPHLDLDRLVSLASRSRDWAGWQAVARIRSVSHAA